MDTNIVTAESGSLGFSSWLGDKEADGEFIYYTGFLDGYYTGFLAEDYAFNRRPDNVDLALKLALQGKLFIYQRRLTQGPWRGSSSWQYCARKLP